MSKEPPTAQQVRQLRSTENLLRQFLKLETGLGNKPEYIRGHEFAFSFTVEQKQAVNALMEGGMSFEEAFDKVKADAGP